MKEEFLHYLWRSKAILGKELLTVRGESVTIEDPGIYNHNQGPDFIYAKIKFQDITWIGNLEMHVKSSDWERHQHSDDANYQNCILHVVWEYDKPVTVNQTELPCIEMKSYVDESYLRNFQFLDSQLEGIPCSPLLKNVPPFILSNQLERSVYERLEAKTEIIHQNLKSLNGNWEALLSEKILNYLMAPVNVHPAEKLWTILGWDDILKIKNDHHQIESALFGVSGLLTNAHTEPYIVELHKTYTFLQKKFQWKQMNAFEWKYSRLRPAHFPDLRLAQWTSFLYRSNYFFSNMLECRSLKDLEQLFDFPLHPYWKYHYTLGGEIHEKAIRKTGRQTVDTLIINAVIPILYSYSEMYFDEGRKKFALELLEQIRPENNKYTRFWEQKMFACKNALQSQAMIHQIKHYCEPRKCLECQIGSYHLSHN